jgi:Phage antirepressor protein KilAC domain.
MANSITPIAAASPFDAIRHTRPNGGEYWSARELMPLLGYDKWERFEDAIERAAYAMKNLGNDVSAEASRLREPFGRTNQMGTNYHLSRYGAYMVAMNGDPRKQEIAAAQAYFAIRTREAETQLPDITSLEGISAILNAGKAALNRALAAERRALELEGPAAQVATMREADGLQTITDLANALKVHAASNFPGVKIYQEDVFDLAGQVGLIIRGNTVRHNQPTARAIEAKWVKPKDHTYTTNSHGRRTNVYARLTPRGYGRLWDAAIKNLHIYGAVLAPAKEIAA